LLLQIHEALHLEQRLGKDLRWFRRLLYHALALYRHDLQQQQQHDSSNDDKDASIPNLEPKYFEEALIALGGSVPSIDKKAATVVDPDLRLQALRDLSGPQVALVLAARRILHRDASKSNETEQQQLTLQRMLHEYKAFYKSSKYSEPMLRRAFTDLLEVGLFRPAADHSGLGPFQYQFRNETLYTNATNVDTIERMPLHLTVDIHREVSSITTCSTALQEWGRHTN